MSIDAYGIHIGFLYFRFYGMIIMVGALAAAFLARHLLKRSGKDPELVWDALIWVLILGAIGARLYHVFTPSKSMLEAGYTTAYYLTHPLEIIMTWQGGLGMPGALIGGFLGLYIFSRRKKLSLGLLADIGAPGVALAQAIGRWGNFINQELYGPPTDLPWGIYIRPEHRLFEYRQFERFHPLFLYESLWNLANAGLLYWLFRKHRQRFKDGDLFIIYLINYSFGRFMLEFMRLDFVPFFGINLNQFVMLLTIIGGGVFLYLRHRRKPVEQE
ncbi:MAG TPA: prolipoprotein diacylglyceryl transferase [Anaerolineae bacterium]|nr:prolipoprotein diacylglyceryl transferase [Anaerolineae bacterium]